MRLLFLISLALIGGCSTQKRIVFPAEVVEGWVNDTRDALCSADPASCDLYDRRPELVAQSSGIPYGDGGYWTPSKRDVERFETELLTAVREERRRNVDDPPRTFEDYTVQYLGYIEGSKRMIAANGHCGTSDWAGEQWLLVFDGGTCVFKASFNSETGELYGPDFNGLA